MTPFDNQHILVFSVFCLFSHLYYCLLPYFSLKVWLFWDHVFSPFFSIWLFCAYMHMHICCLSSLHNLPFFNQLPIYWTPLMTLSPFLFSPVPDSLPPVPPPCPEMLRRPPVSLSFVLCRNLISSNFGRLQGPTRIPLRGWRWRTTWGRRARQSRTIPRSQCGCPTVSCPELFTPKDWLLSLSL